MNLSPKPKSREAIKAWNRQKIIDATIDVITAYGIAGTTIAKVVELAGVSMGLINVHFKSKDALLYEVLRYMARDYTDYWKQSLAKAPNNTVERLTTLIEVDFDPRVLNLKSMGVWMAFRAQARSKPEYVDLVGTRESEQIEEFVSLFTQLNSDSGYDHNPVAVTRCILSMQDGLWTDYFLYPNDFSRKDAIACFHLYLSALYPEHFPVPD
ncbi:MAG: TetR family transcriptional regulator C-terminal domain-containing protein [Pseudomonadales bacterium]